MNGSLNQIFTKVVAANLILVGSFAIVVSVIVIYRNKYVDVQQANKLYIYLFGGLILIILGVILYK